MGRCVPSLPYIYQPNSVSSLAHSAGPAPPSDGGAHRDDRGRCNACDAGQKVLLQRRTGTHFLCDAVAARHARCADLAVLIIDSVPGVHGLFAAQLLGLGLSRKRIFSPNGDARVVAASRRPGLDLAFAEHLPCDRFLARHTALIRQAHHLDYAFVDAHGSFDRGVGPLLRTLADGALLRARPGMGSLVCFAVSDLPDRLRHARERAASVDRVHRLVSDIFNHHPNRVYLCTPLGWRDDGPRCPYQNTMGFFGFHINRRSNANAPPPLSLDEDWVVID